MSRGVDLVVGASIVWIDFLMPLKTHQEKPPRSGILVFAARSKKCRSRMPYKRRSATEPTRSMAGFGYVAVFFGMPE